MNFIRMAPDEWSLISRDAFAVSSDFKTQSNNAMDESWYVNNFDLLTSHRPWEEGTFDHLPDVDCSTTGHGQSNLIDFLDSKLSCDTALLSFELQHNATAINATLLLDLDDSLTATQPQRNSSYTIAKNNASFANTDINDSPLNVGYHSLAAAELLKATPLRRASYTFDKVDSPFIVRANESYTIAKVNSPFVTPKSNALYTVAKGSESFTIAKANASYTISSPPTEVSPVPGSATKNSSFSEAAEKFHSLRRSMSSDSVLPLSQDKISGLSLTTRALVPTMPAPNAAFSAAVADMRLRPGRAPLAAKGPMRAMLPLGQMMRAETEEPKVAEPETKQQCQPMPPSPAKAMRPAAVSTPLRGTPARGTPGRRSISMSPVRRPTPTRSASSGYGQRSPANIPRTQPAQTRNDEPRTVEKKSTGAIPKTSLPTPAGSRLKWPSAKGAKPSGLPQPIAAAKGIPRPVLAVSNPNVRLSRLKDPLRTNLVLLPSVKGKENRC